MKKSIFWLHGLFCLLFFVTIHPQSMAKEVPSTGITLNRAEWGGIFLIFANQTGGEISREQLKGQKELRVEGCVKGSRVSSFTLVISSHGNKKTFSASDHSLTKEMVTALESLETGDAFEFTSVKATLPDQKVVNVFTKKYVVA